MELEGMPYQIIEKVEVWQKELKLLFFFKSGNVLQARSPNNEHLESIIDEIIENLKESQVVYCD